MLRSLFGVVCLASLAMTGCGGKPMPETTPVQGTVRVNGKPQSGLLVRFLPDPDQGNQTSFYASGNTDDQGKYTLSYTFNDEQGEGAAIGWHRVVIMDATMAPGVRRPPSVPYTYASAATTPLKVEVKPDAGNVDLDVKK